MEVVVILKTLMEDVGILMNLLEDVGLLWIPFILKVWWERSKEWWKERDKDWPGWGLDRDGQEPLALAHLVLLHLAEWCAEGPLRDLKGYTLVG